MLAVVVIVYTPYFYLCEFISNKIKIVDGVLGFWGFEVVVVVGVVVVVTVVVGCVVVAV